MPENEKRLQFLLSMIKSRGLEKREVAAMMGVSPQNIFTYFKRDDMRLSYALAIASKLGYELSFSMERDGEGGGVMLRVEELVGKDGLQRLAFLRVAMARYGIERKRLAADLGLNYTGVNRWFKVDDIAISYLYKIAGMYGLVFGVKCVDTRVAEG